jgi:hypothetical protein
MSRFTCSSTGDGQAPHPDARERERKLLRPMPAQVVILPFARTYTRDEEAIIRWGLIPASMDDKWFIDFADDTLTIARSWTGIRVYQVRFRVEGDAFHAVEAVVNGDANEYHAGDAAFEEAMLAWLIEGLLLRRPVPLPRYSGR